MLFQKTESKFGAEPGLYAAKFRGVIELRDNGSPRLGKDGKPMPPGIEFQFEIVTAGPFQGNIVSRITSKTPTMKNSCGRMLDGLAGRALGINESFNVDTCIGRTYQILIDRSAANPARTQVDRILPPSGATGAHSGFRQPDPDDSTF
jgi:hypothetical protein